MTRVYRLLREPFAANPFDGEGSYRFGGRWSSVGTRLVYTAEHLSLAMLEYMAHLDANGLPGDLALAQAEIPDSMSRRQLRPADLPEEWLRFPAPSAIACIGDQFIQQAETALLIVPSALAPVEDNWLINPAHPEFQLLRILPTERFQYDRRLLRSI